jgi:hypothetical protein
MPRKKGPKAQREDNQKEAVRLMNRLGDFVFGKIKLTPSEFAATRTALDSLRPDIKPVAFEGVAEKAPVQIKRTIVDKRGDAAAHRAQLQAPWGSDDDL